MTKKKFEIGKKTLNFLITDTNRRKLSRYRKDRARTRMIRQVSRERESHLDDILRNALKHINPVTQPPVLISQVHHSGGAMLNRLFDGHSEINCLPHEIADGTRTTSRWPEIDLDDKPQDWLEILFEEVDTATIQQKFGGGDEDSTTVPFVFLPLIQEQIFLRYLQTRELIQRRDVIDAYITSCFGAWLDYQNLRGSKKYTTACAAGIATQPESMESFFEIYPESKLISLIRNPEDWLACACSHEPKIYNDARSAGNCWKKSVQAVLEISRKFDDRVCLLKFEDLINRTDSVMRYLSEYLEISFEDILLTPTFNSIPLQPSKSLATGHNSAAFNYLTDAKALEANRRTLIKEMTRDDYQAVLQKVAVI